MNDHFEKYLFHPVRKPLSEAYARIDLIRSKDNPVMGMFYESAYFLDSYTLCEDEYALPGDELLCFMNASGEGEALGATVSLTVNGVRFTTDRSFMIRIPARVPHGRIIIEDVKAPVLYFCAASGREHVCVPEENWNTRDVPAFEEMITYAGGEGNVFMRLVSGETVRSDNSSVIHVLEPDGPGYSQECLLHDNPKIICFYGCDPEKPYELGGEFTLYLNGEKLTVTEPTLCYIAPYVIHGPVITGKVEKKCLVHTFAQYEGPVTVIGLESPEAEMTEPW